VDFFPLRLRFFRDKVRPHAGRKHSPIQYRGIPGNTRSRFLPLLPANHWRSLLSSEQSDGVSGVHGASSTRRTAGKPCRLHARPAIRCRRSRCRAGSLCHDRNHDRMDHRLRIAGRRMDGGQSHDGGIERNRRPPLSDRRRFAYLCRRFHGHHSSDSFPRISLRGTNNIFWSSRPTGIHRTCFPISCASKWNPWSDWSGYLVHRNPDCVEDHSGKTWGRNNWAIQHHPACIHMR
jgi:hypothetical protein